MAQLSTTSTGRSPSIPATWLHMWDSARLIAQRASRIRPSTGIERPCCSTRPIVDAHVKLGNAYREAGRFDEAVASYQRANELQPQTGWLLLLVGDTLMDAGKTDEALAVYGEALTAQPDYEQDPTYAARVATVYQAQGKLDDALAAAEASGEISRSGRGKHSRGHLQLQADILSDQERWQAAIDLYTQVLELNPERAQSMRGLALAYEAQGRNQEAVTQWRAYLQQAPKGEYADEAREHLRRLRRRDQAANHGCTADHLFLGVGGAMAQAPADNHTAFLVRTHTSTILLDSGPSIMRQLELTGVGVEELTHIYISHQHGDHSLGLPMVLLNRVLFWPELPLTVMAAPEVLDAAHGIVALAYPDLMQRIDAIVGFTPLDTNPSPLPLPFDSTVTYRLAPGRAHRAQLGHPIGLFIGQKSGGKRRYRTLRACRPLGNRGNSVDTRFL